MPICWDEFHNNYNSKPLRLAWWDWPKCHPKLRPAIPMTVMPPHSEPAYHLVSHLLISNKVSMNICHMIQIWLHWKNHKNITTTLPNLAPSHSTYAGQSFPRSGSGERNVANWPQWIQEDALQQLAIWGPSMLRSKEINQRNSKCLGKISCTWDGTSMRIVND